MIDTFALGQDVRVTAVFTDPDNDDAAVDPDVVKLSFKDPAETVTTWTYDSDTELVRDSAGNYHALIDADAAGIWYYRWWSTGDGKAAKEGTFRVEAANAIA